MKEHLRTALVHIRRSPYQALAAMTTMALTFFVATILAILTYASASTLRYFETRPQIIAFLKSEATAEEVSALQRQLTADSRVKNIKYVSQAEALEIYREATRDNPLLSELVSPKVFPASIEFSVTDLSFAQDLIAEVKTEAIVDQVVFTASLGGSENLGDVIGNLRRITSYLRIGGEVILVFLLSSSFLILLVIIGMRVAARREEIEILKLIGATPGFIRMPFLIEGVFYAGVGAILGWLVGGLLILYLMPSLTSYFGEIPILPAPTSPQFFGLFGVILAGQLLLAFFLGATGSLLATRKYLRG